MNIPSYSEYYQNTMNKHSIGFKLVLGGTGLGKTSGISEVIQDPASEQHKFIYFANRKQLVEEVAQSLNHPGASPCYVILHRDLEAVILTLREHRRSFYELLESPLIIDNIRRWNDKTPLKRIDLPTVKRACQILEELITEYITVPKVLEEQMEGYARIVLAAFKAALLGANNKKGSSSVYQKLADHLVIQSLFPFIAFKRRPEIRLLLSTLQKAFYGFFDGHKTLNLTKLEGDDGNYVIFLDEFDFLENDLIGLICRSPQISNPFRVVELFYRAMTRHKLPLETYPLSNDIRSRINAIKEIIDTLQTEGKNDGIVRLNFPEINQFTSSAPHKLTSDQRNKTNRAKTSPAIFRTQHTISTDHLYLRETSRSFELFTDPDQAEEGTLPALRMFDAVSGACERILLLFKELERGNDEILYRELIRHCFQDTIFPEELALISQFAIPHRQGKETPLSALLEAGYSLYDIHDLQQRTDKEEVEVRHYGIHLTPESILCSLARHNLVFGLSATADIQRHVHHFNLNWLQQQINYIQVDETDKEIIRMRNQFKATKRNNQLELAIVDGLDLENEYQRNIYQFIAAAATDEDFGDDTREGHLKRRVHLFFAALLWINTQATVTPIGTGAHLLFVNTFRQIKLIFDRYHTPSNNLFSITKRESDSNRWFDIYDILLQNQNFIVVFYNAQIAKTIRQSQDAQHTFDKLFWENKPVVVVTQYLSAGNGVNLQYWTSPEKKRQQDFTHIGLLETPYFYFGKPDPELTWDEKIAILKENIWYQAKLYTSNVISQQRFLQILSTLNDPWEWNRRYQEDTSTRVDALFNYMATFMQAIGRIERIWDDTPDQTILLSRDVYKQFQRFCAPEFEQLRQERESTISHNLQRIFQRVAEDLPRLERQVRRYKDARLGAKDDQCRQAVQQLLNRLQGLRQGSGEVEARVQWQHLRQASLKHEFHDQLLNEYSCVAESPYYRNGALYLTPQREIIPAHLAQPDTYHWRLDGLYTVIRDNRVIRDYFLEHNYKIAFSPNHQRFFTPYCYQAILTGAVGEEAITALLLDEGFELEDIPDAVFELADLKLQNVPWYIDCKNYNEQTLDRFTAPIEDPAWHPKLNEEHFAERARKKVKQLQSYHGTPVKLIYLNLVSGHSRLRGYYDFDFNEVPFEDASIILIQGALQRNAPNAYHAALEHLLHDLHSTL